MRDDGEPISRGQLDRRAADRQGLGNAIWFVAFFAGAVLVNGILAILFIALLQALGPWGPSTTETTSAAFESTDEVRSTVMAFVRRPATPSIGV